MPPGRELMCDATLRHAHGVTRCWLPADHEGKHEGECDSCFEADDPAELSWTEHREAWRP